MIGHAGAFAQLPADDAPVEVGKAEVEQHEVAVGGGERRGAGADQLDLEAFALQARAQRLGDGGVVFHDQQAHGHMFARARRATHLHLCQTLVTRGAGLCQTFADCWPRLERVCTVVPASSVLSREELRMDTAPP